MKSLRSTFAIFSCTVIIVGIGFPGISETLKDIQTQPQSIGIGNKDYRNKQSTPSMVGSWKSGVNDNEHRHTDPQEIYFDMASDFSAIFAIRKAGQADTFGSGNYRYTPTKDTSIVIQEGINSDGEIVHIIAIKWISNNEFITRMLKNPEAPHRVGVQRRFVRIDEPVATNLQKRAQQAEASRKARSYRNSYDNYRDAVNSWDAFYGIYK